MKRKLILLILLWNAGAVYGGVTFGTAEVFAPTSTPQTHFTLQEYISTYLKNAPEVRIEKNDLLTARADYQNAFIESFLPSFSASVNADKSYSRPDKPHSLDEFSHFDSSVHAGGNWNLFNSGRNRLSYRHASLDYQKAQISFDKYIQQEVLTAVRNYYDLLLQQKLLKVYQTDLEIAKKQYEQDKVLYDNGLKTHSDLLSSETSYRSSQLSVFSAQNDYDNTLTSFNISINQPGDTPITLDETLDTSIIHLPSLDTDLTNALAHRHDIRLERLNLEQQNISVRVGKLNTLPSVYVDLFASTGRSLNRHEWWGYNYGVSAGISFDLGFLYIDKWRTRQNLERTKENAYLSFEQFLRSLRDDVVQRRNALLLKQQSLEISKLRLEAANQKFEATQTKYKNGLMSATDLTVARQEMISAQIEHARLITELTDTKMRYQYAIGQNIFDYTLEDL